LHPHVKLVAAVTAAAILLPAAAIPGYVAAYASPAGLLALAMALGIGGAGFAKLTIGASRAAGTADPVAEVPVGLLAGQILLPLAVLIYLGYPALSRVLAS
jgi:hypothetical protein